MMKRSASAREFKKVESNSDLKSMASFASDTQSVASTGSSSRRSLQERQLATYRNRFGYYRSVTNMEPIDEDFFASEESLLPIMSAPKTADRLSLMDDHLQAGQWTKHTELDVEDYREWAYHMLTDYNGMVFKRTKKQCIHLIIYYLLVYSAVLLPLVPMGFIYRYLFLSIDRPKHSTILLTEPGLNFRPRPAEYSHFNTLIQFNRNDREKYLRLVKSVNEIVKNYEPHNHTSTPYTEDMETYWTKVCSFTNPADDRYACRLNTQNFGSYCYRNMEYGYPDGQPCILLRPNKIYGWRPEPYDTFEELLAAGFPIQKGNIEEEKQFDPRYIPISCVGETPVDEELLGPIDFHYPYEPGKKGIPTYFFPYLNQKNFKSPGVMVNPWNVTISVVVRVVCHLWARNIPHDREGPSMMPRGGVQFELLIDNGIVEKWTDSWPTSQMFRGRGRGMVDTGQ